MEVMFAIGVVLIGLMGLAALIPVASHYAHDSLRIDRAAAITAARASEAVARGMNDLDNLWVYDDASGAGDFASNKSDSPGFSRSGGPYGAICIDPLGLPQGTAIPTSNNSFHYGCFPYYVPNVDPTVAPNAVAGGGPTSPRMWRATLLRPDGSVISTRNAESIFRVSDDLSFSLPEDRTRGADSVFSFGAGGVSSRASAGRYSWIATLVPPSNGGDYYEMSTVVIEDRLNLLPDLSVHTVSDPDDNANQERITLVVPGSNIGFSGGAGGDIQIQGSAYVSTDITPGEWVMLSRQPYTSGGSLGTQPAQHRWYRVVAVDDPAYSDDGETWTRWVTLQGPDWTFTDNSNNGGGATFCTIVEGAVAVTTTTVRIE